MLKLLWSIQKTEQPLSCTDIVNRVAVIWQLGWYREILFVPILGRKSLFFCKTKGGIYNAKIRFK
ncbi:MAG: hypothetical protein A2Y23_13685 [Clostridiales bacterium GWB2_37_7]|nr:MAG: hypothetical protein A2Y23_13685 [Clostridiales bacterium GWB2_37_7]